MPSSKKATPRKRRTRKGASPRPRPSPSRNTENSARSGLQSPRTRAASRMENNTPALLRDTNQGSLLLTKSSSPPEFSDEE